MDFQAKFGGFLQDSGFTLEEELQNSSDHHEPPTSTSTSSLLSEKSAARGRGGDKLDLSFLPDELSGQEEQRVPTGAEAKIN